jgi:hypothetical protein
MKKTWLYIKEGISQVFESLMIVGCFAISISCFYGMASSTGFMAVLNFLGGIFTLFLTGCCLYSTGGERIENDKNNK